MTRNRKTKLLVFALGLAALTGIGGCGYVERVNGDGEADGDGDGLCPEGRELCVDRCVDLQTDLLNCGTCGHICQDAPHGSGICDEGLCGLECDDGWWHLDGDLINGCEYECTVSGDGNDVCNGVDDDCDGRVDNFDAISCPMGEVVACTTECGSEGAGRCNEFCRLEGCVPPGEACNGLDDDCDGEADNGFDCERESAVACTTTCGSTGTGTCTYDCMLPPPGACQVPDEACNWIDDDCDGEVDEGLFGVITAETTVADGAGTEHHPVLAFGDSVFLAAWEDTADTSMPELYGLALSPDGTAASDVSRLVGNASVEMLGDAAWNGTHFGIAFASDNLTDSQDLWFAVFDEGAELQQNNRCFSRANDQTYPSIVWADSAWASAWQDNRSTATLNNVFFGLIDPVTLTVDPGNEFQVTNAAMDHQTRPGIAWSGSGFAVVWTQSFMTERNVCISLLNDDGTTAVDDRPLSEGFSSAFFPTVLWTSSEWVVAWAGSREPGGLGYYMARVDVNGNRIGDLVQIDDAERLFEELFPPLAMELAPGLGLFLAWQKEVLAGRRDLYAAPFSFDLVPLSEEPILVAGSDANASPALAWDGAAFGLVWIHYVLEPDFISSVSFARLGCTI